MQVSDYIVEQLIKLGITDVFGVPGGVILELMYAIDRSNKKISAHLAYNEQGAVFEAIGYAQSSGRIGVVYATKGPGILNTVTGIAEAYMESIPLLVITAHTKCRKHAKTRFLCEQEVQITDIVKNITKYRVDIDSLKRFPEILSKAMLSALEGRRGPVVLDIETSIFVEKIQSREKKNYPIYHKSFNRYRSYFFKKLSLSKRPVFLIGDGLRYIKNLTPLYHFCEKHSIPVLSSRGATDLGLKSGNYFGYIGSHGVRYANFIIDKADFLIVLGNRLGFPRGSKSFEPLLKNKNIFRVEIDAQEMNFCYPCFKDIRMNVQDFITMLDNVSVYRTSDWLNVCKEIRHKTETFDMVYPVSIIKQLLDTVFTDFNIVCDVGNNEFWVTRAFAESKNRNKNLISKTFGTLGCAIPKAIGCYYSDKLPVVCFVGDQGFQFNIQELELIAKENIPICVVVLNNHSSGMIRSRQVQKYDSQFIHTTEATGYGCPNIHQIADAYSISYATEISSKIKLPMIFEMNIDSETDLELNLPIGNPIYKMNPCISESLIEEILKL